MDALLAQASDPSDWPPSWAFLRPLDASLRCGLCYDIFRAPVALRECAHVFCSSCIRTHINQPGGSGSFCPNCRQKKAYDSELMPQPALEAAADGWRNARDALVEKMNEAQTLQDDRDALRAEIAEGRVQAPKRAAPEDEGGRRLRPRQARASLAEPASPDVDYRSLQAADTVQCPICSRSFTAADLNTHLDRGCDPSAPPSNWLGAPAHDPFANAKRLTRPQYQLKSERDLRKLLSSLDLPSHGNKERLVERHRQWVNLYNANLDASPANRESLARLRRHLQAWDRGQDEVASHNKDKVVANERQYQSWLNTHRGHYADLAAQARASLAKKPTPSEPPEDA
ncbi:RING-type E3 ubiquitin transferase [Malassezia japonica]|uniref:Postreplication repair E3 ubiquitin-protein ligase RAD18 n=1 Tax=Malassezia japonica TaxID=223818 RepID=A0AAF0F3H5_9BASI|nr:RING-type E3 ubiquitin transferase [Malassezia japonica]WFD37702.1 RING-type E3 ubiquitin transferase [Malassezia japonica]